MAKIAIIGAGGYVFPFRLIGDLLSFPELREGTFALMDVDRERAEQTADAARDLIDHYRFPTRVETTTDRRRALDGANYVIATFQVGGYEPYRLDIEIPRRYGIDQPVGDTLGPGGVFRFLRTAPVLRALADEMQELCPDALLLNYVNPMAMNCWYLNHLGVETVGLCHSVQGTSRMLARHLDVPYDEVRFRAAGINHQAWFLEFRRGDEDLYPRLRQVMTEQHLPGRTGDGRTATGDRQQPGDSTYEGGNERVRTEIMASFGYFHTESSHHASEYLPYFRKSPEHVREFLPERWDSFERYARRDAADRTAELLAGLKEELAPSIEYGALIVESIETGQPRTIYGNVANHGNIASLPDGCCVEVPCLVDGNGIQPTTVGSLPPQCAAVNRTNVNVQHLAVEAILTENRDHIQHAVTLDLLTGAVLTLPEIRSMVEEMLTAESAWLPEFARPAGTPAT